MPPRMSGRELVLYTFPVTRVLLVADRTIKEKMVFLSLQSYGLIVSICMVGESNNRVMFPKSNDARVNHTSTTC
jgi:hypothetical protein